MKKKMLILMISLAAMLLGACAGIPDNQADMSAIKEKLNKIDAYKEGISASQLASQQDYDSEMDTFRSFNFGVSREIVQSMETLPLSQAYTDALDYTGSGVYGYDMMLTYWFNADSQLGSVSYNMQGEEYQAVVDSLTEGLRGDYGEPVYIGYYDTSNNELTFDTNDEAQRSIDTGDAYYNAVWWLDNDVHIELYARKIDTGYDFWIYYTDYNYYSE